MHSSKNQLLEQVFRLLVFIIKPLTSTHIFHCRHWSLPAISGCCCLESVLLCLVKKYILASVTHCHHPPVSKIRRLTDHDRLKAWPPPGADYQSDSHPCLFNFFNFIFSMFGFFPFLGSTYHNPDIFYLPWTCRPCYLALSWQSCRPTVTIVLHIPMASQSCLHWNIEGRLKDIGAFLC